MGVLSLLELLVKCYMNSYWLAGIASAVQYKLSNLSGKWQHHLNLLRAATGMHVNDCCGSTA
jgi:hypothetical protein